MDRIVISQQKHKTSQNSQSCCHSSPSLRGGGSILPYCTISKFSSPPKNPTNIFIRFLRGGRAKIGAVFLTMLLRFTSLVVVFFLVLGSVNSHEESGEWSCESDSESQVQAEFNPGVVTVDGHGDDWKDVNGFDFSLLPALDPDEENAYKGGEMTVKALHDGKDVFFLLQVDGEYVYSKGDSNKCPSVALMFQIGESASYHNMGGCKESRDKCTNKTCKGYEVDIMHFSIGNAIPGRLYGGNPVDNSEGNGGDRFGHLVDLYAWTPHCRFLDGISPTGNVTSAIAQNNWKGAWWHDSFTTHSGFVEEDSPYASSSQKGTYYFEFSRPLRTMDRLQQDVQFTIGESSKFSVAFWYPLDGNAWHGSGHYSVSCDWVPLEILSGYSVYHTRDSLDAAGVFSLLLSIVAICVSIFVGFWVSNKNKSVHYTSMETGRRSEELEMGRRSDK